jgi:hypothetical protein
MSFTYRKRVTSFLFLKRKFLDSFVPFTQKSNIIKTPFQFQKAKITCRFM